MKTVRISLNSIDKVKSFVNDLAKFDVDFAFAVAKREHLVPIKYRRVGFAAGPFHQTDADAVLRRKHNAPRV